MNTSDFDFVLLDMGIWGVLTRNKKCQNNLPIYVHRIFNLMSYITLFFINIDNFQIIYPYIATLSNIESAHGRFRSVSSVEHLTNNAKLSEK